MAYDIGGGKTLDQPSSTLKPGTPDIALPDLLGAIENDLVRINTSMELFCRKLGRVLPDISLEIYRTYRKASQTMDSLISESPLGLIEITVSFLDVCLARVDKHMREQTADESLLVKALGTVRTDLPAVIDALERLQTLIDTLGATPLAHAQGMDSTPDMQTRIVALNGITRGMGKDLAEIGAALGTLAALSSGIEALQADIIRTVERYTALGVNALKDTLNSVIAILKDLIARSNATKGPIQTIMTALQVHDIVRQDLENILKAFARLRALALGEDHPDGAAFQRHACLAAGELLLEIGGVIYDHSRTIDSHIQSVYEIVAGVGVDKIHLAELLLINAQDQSTLDRALRDISAMFQDLITHLRTLITHRRRQADALLGLRGRLQALDRTSRQAAEQAGLLAESLKTLGRAEHAQPLTAAENLCALISTLMSLLPPPPMIPAQPHDAIDACIALINEGDEAMRDNLLKIKHLLADSIDGINDYADRCMVAVRRFQRRMERLHRFMVRIPDIAAALKGSFDIPTPSGEDTLAERPADIRDDQLYEILFSLRHPHIKTLHRDEGPTEDVLADDGLTLF